MAASCCSRLFTCAHVRCTNANANSLQSPMNRQCRHSQVDEPSVLPNPLPVEFGQQVVLQVPVTEHTEAAQQHRTTLHGAATQMAVEKVRPLGST